MKRFVLTLVVVSVAVVVLWPVVAADPPRRVETGDAVLVIHGGEADLPENITPREAEQYKPVLRQALRAGYAALQKGTSLDAVEAAIRVMEDSPLFNAGKGAVFTHDGHNELDASIMEGTRRKAGAVAGVTVLKNPISAARAVMEKSPHVLLAGRGAENFIMRLKLAEPAYARKLEIRDPHYFWTQQRWDELQKEWQKNEKASSAGKQGRAPARRRHLGTVGAVAVKDGKLAAGTSTGGMTDKLSGRVGDSPIIGAGTYADDRACAVSCTGWGEYFIEYAVAHEITARVKYRKVPVETAADELINGELMHAGDKGAPIEGGAIVLDPRGHFAVTFNAEAKQMNRGYVTADGKTAVAVLEDRMPPPR
ncbi:MAG TPA: isoaspartyl peptidase/L-asparaginase [Gemmataceae bacterium]|nr:isoaspartyl peptidase/L-asparaginase [Gemmataceae bacterium]